MALTGAVGQIRERTARRRMIGDPSHDFCPQVRREPCANPSSEVQAALLEVADEDRIEVRGVGLVSTDDELLTWAELDLDPRGASVTGHIDRVSPFRHHTFQAQLPDLIFDAFRRTWQDVGEQ